MYNFALRTHNSAINKYFVVYINFESGARVEKILRRKKEAKLKRRQQPKKLPFNQIRISELRQKRNVFVCVSSLHNQNRFRDSPRAFIILEIFNCQSHKWQTALRSRERAARSSLLCISFLHLIRIIMG